MLSTSSSKQRRGEAVPMPPDLGGDDDEEEATGTKGARCTAASPVGLERLRRANRLTLRTSLMWPNTGSTVCARLA